MATHLGVATKFEHFLQSLSLYQFSQFWHWIFLVLSPTVRLLYCHVSEQETRNAAVNLAGFTSFYVKIGVDKYAFTCLKY